MIVIDTNAFIRFFTNDIPNDAKKVQKLITVEQEIFIPEIVFGEIDYVLSSVYKVPKKNIEEAYKFIECHTNFLFYNYIRIAIKIFEENNIGMYDSLVVAQSQGLKLATFDKKLLKVKGIKKYWD